MIREDRADRIRTVYARHHSTFPATLSINQMIIHAYDLAYHSPITLPRSFSQLSTITHPAVSLSPAYHPGEEKSSCCHKGATGFNHHLRWEQAIYTLAIILNHY